MLTLSNNNLVLSPINKILKVSSNIVEIQLKNRIVCIDGEDLRIIEISTYEIKIYGIFKGIMFYEQ